MEKLHQWNINKGGSFVIQAIICYLKGYVKIRIIGYSPERFLNALSHRGIYVWNLHPGKGYYELNLQITDFKKMKPIIKKTGTKVVIQGRYGLPFFLHRYRKRKLFFIGGGICLSLIYVLSLFVWSIDIVGNISRTDETLLAFLETKQVCHGMKKADINCPQIVKEIRKEYNDIIWVSVAIKGSRLTIQIKENEDSLPTMEEKEEKAQDIVANKDGVITDIIVRKGVPMVAAGGQIKKGDVLVSGRVEVKNDAAEVIGYQYQEAEATIRGQTTIPYESSQPLVYKEKKIIGEEGEVLFLRVGKYRMTLGNSKLKEGCFTVKSNEHSLRIGKHFILPVSYGSRIAIPYQAEEKPYTEEELRLMLTKKFEKDCEEIEKKGVEILENNVKIYKENHLAVAKGELTVIMDIGEKAETEILEVPIQELPDEERKQADGNE